MEAPDPRPKPLLIDAVGPRLPGSVASRPKRGFDLPLAAWFRGPWRQHIGDAMTDHSTWSALGFDPTVPPVIWDRFLRRDARITVDQIGGLAVLADYASRHGLTRAG